MTHKELYDYAIDKIKTYEHIDLPETAMIIILGPKTAIERIRPIRTNIRITFKARDGFTTERIEPTEECPNAIYFVTVKTNFYGDPHRVYILPLI